MSARSPRASFSGASSAEVAEDFAECLNDLQINNKYEINNLTIIAKENTEHAQAISKALEKHIKTTAPSRKLPAIYVLDSIVKNVGTPYTLYLGSNLYSTFMDAYTLVDGQTRRLMEGVLKTWKEPITGSIDPRPVFPLDTVRPIENALIKARTIALQSQRTVPQQPYRNTPTPPQYNRPPNQAYNSPLFGQPPSQAYPNQQQNAYSQTALPGQNHVQIAHQDLQEIKNDLAHLVAKSHAEFSTNPFDHGLQTRLQALLKLNEILNGQRLSDTELEMVRNQVSAMSGGTSSLPAAKPTPPPPSQAASQWQSPSIVPQLQPQQPLVSTQALAPPSITQTPTPPFLFPPGALSGLQALLANSQKPSTPQMRAVAPVLQNASHAQLQNVQQQTSAAPVVNGADLLAALAKNGILPKPPIPLMTPQPPPPPISAPPSLPTSAADLLRSLQGKIQPVPVSDIGSGRLSTTPTNIPNTTGTPLRVPMTMAALKSFNPSLVHSLYEAQPNQCNNCGRRFAATETGRTKKERHLDWHFRTNQRLADVGASARANHRLDYPDEMTWVSTREFDVSTTTAGEAATGLTDGSGNPMHSSKPRRPEDESVAAPPGVTKNTCSICFEDMKSAYNEDRQRWVFMNAKRHGGRIVHATCLAELQKVAPNTLQTSASVPAAPNLAPSALVAALAAAGHVPQRQRSATPDSSLGKRKAEESLFDVASIATRLKTE